MVKNEIKDYGKSNRTKLLNLSRQTKGADYNLDSGDRSVSRGDWRG